MFPIYPVALLPSSSPRDDTVTDQLLAAALDRLDSVLSWSRLPVGYSLLVVLV